MAGGSIIPVISAPRTCHPTDTTCFIRPTTDKSAR